MDESQLIKIISEITEREFVEEDINLNTNLFEDLNFDSLKVIILISILEQKFDYVIKESDLQDILFVRDILEKIDQMS